MTLLYGLLVLAVFLGSSCLASAGTIVTLPRQATVPGPEITLGEIAMVRADGETLAGRLRSLGLGYAAPAGASRIIDRLLIAQRIQRLVPFPKVQFAGAVRVVVATEARKISSEMLVDSARQWLLTQLGTDPTQIMIHPLSVPDALTLPRGELSLRVQSRGGPIQDGPVSLVVEAAVIDGKGRRTVRYATVSLQLERIREVVVATRPLARKSVIRPSDVRILRRAGSRVPHGVLTDLGQAVGKELVREVRAGDALAARSVKVPIVVQRGNPVVLYLNGPGFQVTARGIAMENGGIGQMIRVINQASRKVLYGRVEGNGSVRIPF